MRLFYLIIIIPLFIFSGFLIAKESKKPESYEVDREAVRRTMKEDKIISDSEQCKKMGGTWIIDKCCFDPSCMHPNSEQFKKLREGT